jgi:hypothetical protein
MTGFPGRIVALSKSKCSPFSGSFAREGNVMSASVWKGYTKLMKAVVRVDIEKATLILSPAYDIGHTEAQLRARYKAKFISL